MVHGRGCRDAGPRGGAGCGGRRQLQHQFHSGHRPDCELERRQGGAGADFPGHQRWLDELAWRRHEPDFESGNQRDHRQQPRRSRDDRFRDCGSKCGPEPARRAILHEQFPQRPHNSQWRESGCRRVEYAHTWWNEHGGKHHCRSHFQRQWNAGIAKNRHRHVDPVSGQHVHWRRHPGCGHA
jgi:hypothetical protein